MTCFSFSPGAAQKLAANDQSTVKRESKSVKEGSERSDSDQDGIQSNSKEAERASESQAGAEANTADAADGEEKTEKTEKKGRDGQELTEQEVAEVTQMKKRDRQVRAHEQAHKAVAGSYAGAIHYDYETGPDQARYVVSGHVPIDMSEIPDDPKRTAEKMQVIQRAAMAPVDPSATDRSVASRAARIESKARMEMARERYEEVQSSSATEAAKPGQEKRKEDSGAVSEGAEVSRSSETQGPASERQGEQRKPEIDAGASQAGVARLERPSPAFLAALDIVA